MITQGGWIYSIQFNLKMYEFFYENPRNMKGRYKMLLICLGKNKKLFILEIMKLRVKMRSKIFPNLNKKCVANFATLFKRFYFELNDCSNINTYCDCYDF